MNKIIPLLVFGILSLTACNDKLEPLGPTSDSIKLSQKSAVFSSGADSIAIKTQGEWWWVNNIQTNDSLYYGWIVIDPDVDSYAIHKSDFTVEKRKGTTLFIKMPPNTSLQEKTLSITLQSGNYFDHVYITQKPKE